MRGLYRLCLYRSMYVMPRYPMLRHSQGDEIDVYLLLNFSQRECDILYAGLG